MKKLLTGLLALAFLVPAAALAQSSTQQDNSQPSQQQRDQQNDAAAEDHMSTSTQPLHNMSGTVSNGGMTLTSNNTAYQVSNPDKLKSYDNQTVNVEYQYNTDKNSIKINKVNGGQ